MTNTDPQKILRARQPARPARSDTAPDLDGLTVREELASRNMVALIANPDITPVVDQLNRVYYRQIAGVAVACADALLEVLHPDK